jgi:hypothetical protein
VFEEEEVTEAKFFLSYGNSVDSRCPRHFDSLIKNFGFVEYFEFKIITQEEFESIEILRQ